MTVSLSLLRMTLVAATTCSALHAACPTGDDLATGIVTRTDTDTTEIHRRTRPDWVQIQVTFDDGEGTVLDLYHGLYLQTMMPMTEGVLDPSGLESFVTTEAVTRWPAPRPDDAWRNEAPGGGEARSGAMRPVTIGDCRYDGYDVTLVFEGDAAYAETYTVLPDLGIALLVRIEEGAQVDDYGYVSLVAAE